MAPATIINEVNTASWTLDNSFLVQRRELRYAHWPVPVQEVFYLEGDFDMLRSDEYDVFGDGSARTVPTPGPPSPHW